jgi:hypothetical protein
MPLFRLCSVCFVAMGLTSTAHAAYPVQVLEGVGPDRKLPQLRLGVGFVQEYQRVSISREFVEGGPDGEARDVRELDYESIRRELVIEARVGVVENLEFRLTAPIVLQLDSDIEFSDGVQGRSTIFDSPNADDPTFATRFPITTVPQERNRAGFGDLSLGLGWSPITDTPDRAWPTITLGLDVRLPTGTPWDPADVDALPSTDGSGGVGSGQTTFDLSVGLSKRGAWGVPAFDPYFELGVELPVVTSSLEDDGYEPPVIGRVRAGSEVVLAEDTARGRYYGIDFGVQVRFIGSGRTRSPLSDYLPDFNQTAVDADLVTRTDLANPDNYNRRVDDPAISCLTDPETGDAVLPGVPCGEFTQVEQHLQLDGHIGARIQPHRNFTFLIGASIGFQNDHFITGESAGEDTDPASAAGQQCGGTDCVGRINRENSRGEDERSRFFDPRYDAVGGRFRAEQVLVVGAFATAIARF